MSISGFDNAIKSNVDSYSNNIAILRANQIMGRNTALDGLKSEVEKWGEVAKIGLELPVGIEGVKGALGKGRDLYNYVRGEGMDNAKNISNMVKGKVGIGRDAINKTLSKGRNIIESGRGKVEGATSSIRDSITSQRHDNLRAYAGESKNSVEGFSKNLATGEDSQTGAPGRGVIKKGSNPLRKRFTRERVLPGEDNSINDSRGGAPNIPDYDELNERFKTLNARGDAGDLNDASRGEYKESAPAPDRDGGSIEMADRAPPAVSTQVPIADMPTRGSDAQQSVADPSEISDAKLPSGVGQQTQLAAMDYTEPAFGGKGGGEIRDATRPEMTGDTSLEDYKSGRGAPRTLNKLAGNENDRGSGYAQLDDAVEDSVSDARYAPPGSGAEPPISPIEGGGEGLAEKIASGTGEEVATEETLGGIFDATGIFAPLGALLEGIGAITEVASVGAGAYGAVQSMVDVNLEDKLRDTPLPAIAKPTMDLGGRVTAPILA